MIQTDCFLALNAQGEKLISPWEDGRYLIHCQITDSPAVIDEMICALAKLQKYLHENNPGLDPGTGLDPLNTIEPIGVAQRAERWAAERWAADNAYNTRPNSERAYARYGAASTRQ